MEKRHFNRKRCPVAAVATAVAAAAFAGFAHNADAALNLKLVEGGTGLNGNTSINIGSLTAVTLDVWATVTGANGTSSDDGLQIANMSFASGGSLLGDISSTGPVSPWNSNGSQAGTQYGTAGDLDLGSTDPSVAAGHWIAISSGVQSGTGTASNGAGSFLLGSVTFTPTGGSGSANISLDPRAATQGALWFEDSTITDPGGGDPLIWSNDKNWSTGVVTAAGAVISFAGGVGSPTWISTLSGNWSDTGNWDGGHVTLSSDVVTFAGNISGPLTVTVNTPQTVAGMLFNSNANNYTVAAGSNLTVAAGAALNVTGNQTITGTVTYGGDVTKSGLGTLTVDNVRTTGALAVSGGTLQVAAGGGTAGTSVVDTVAINAGSQLDLTDHKLVVKSNTAAAVNSQVSAGANTPGAGQNPIWDGEGIMTSAPIIPGDAKRRAIGVAQNSVNTIPLTTFAGQSVTASDILVGYTFAGDANMDGGVNFSDFLLFQQNFNQSGKLWQDGDFNYDSSVNFSDFLVFQQNFGSSLPTAPAVDGVTAVPEPSTLAVLGIAGLAGLRRRRRI